MDKVFDDKRVAVAVLMGWLILVMTLFKDIGLLDTTFMQFGPSATAKFMGVQLDTWYKWGMVATFTMVNTSMNDFMSDAISPWILNTITDHKSRYIPYPKYMCLLIAQLWAIYCNLMSVFGMFLAMTQIDFVLIRMFADLTVNTYTNLKFMRHKQHSPDKYHDIEMQTMMPPQQQHHHIQSKIDEHHAVVGLTTHTAPQQEPSHSGAFRFSIEDEEEDDDDAAATGQSREHARQKPQPHA